MIKTVSKIDDIDIAGDIRRDINRALSDEKLQSVEEKALNKMDEIKNRETRQGNSPAKGGRWNNRYNRQYANRRKGGRRSPVTLRDRDRDIEKTRTVNVNKGTELRFRDRFKGIIFGYHHYGTARGGKYRQVYPKSDKQVPPEIDVVVNREIFRLLNR